MIFYLKHDLETALNLFVLRLPQQQRTTCSFSRTPPGDNLRYPFYEYRRGHREIL